MRAVLANWLRSDRVLVGLFLLGLALPGLFSINQLTQPRLIVENRWAAPPPTLPQQHVSTAEIKRFARETEAWINDRIGGRRRLVELRSSIAYFGFSTSAFPTVFAGKDGWLYLSAPPIIEDIQRRGVVPRDILGQWRDLLRERTRMAAARGMTYLLVVAPDKQSIYPEYLPGYFPTPDQAARLGPTRLDQVLTFLTDRRLSDTVLDLRPPLLAAKAQGRLYSAHDSHWNMLGAEIAYRAILGRLQALGVPVGTDPTPAAITAPVRVRRADLGVTLGIRVSERAAALRTDLIPCGAPLPHPLPPGEALQEVPEPLFATRCPGKPGRLLMFRDSFGVAMTPLLAQSFGEAVFVWDRPTPERLNRFIEQVQPTVIIDMRVERAMRHM